MQKKLMYEPEIIRRKLPGNILEKDIFAFQPEIQRTLLPAYRCEIENAFVTNDGVVYENQKLITESLLDPEHEDWFPKNYFFLQNVLKKKTSIRGNKPVVLCFNYWSDGYFHWVTEVLPKLFCIKSLLKDATMLMPYGWGRIHNRRSVFSATIRPGKADNSLQKLHASTLSPFNIKELHYISFNSCVSVERLILVPPITPSGNYRPALMNEIRSLYHDHFIKGSDVKKYPEKIYISRAKSPRRKIINENEITELLRQHGFSILFFEDLSFAEQVRHAFHSKFIISYHGAGLTNILFMQPGSGVFELSALDENRNLCYYSLANAMDVNYYYQFCRKVKPEVSVQNADVFVDPDELKKNLASFLQS